MTPNRDIINRLFKALDILKEKGEITGLGDFCERYGFNRMRYLNVRNHPDSKMYKTIEVEALYVLVRDFNFSAHWLLTGQGVSRI